MENNYHLLPAFVLFCWLCYKELSRANKKRLLLRLLAVTLAISSLVLLLFPITYSTSVNYKPEVLRILTAGAKLPDLIDGLYYTADSNMMRRYSHKTLKFVPDFSYYLQGRKAVKKLVVYGSGLDEGQLKGLEKYDIEFQPSAPPSGLISCSWSSSLRETAPLIVRGTYENQSSRPVHLYLEGLGRRADSIIVAANSTKKFVLKAVPRQNGLIIYQLRARQGTATVSQEKIPFEVKSSPPVRVLILSSLPDFEYKFLRNWLYGQQHQVVVRTRVSKDKFSSDYLNINALEANISKPELFDLIIASEEELAVLDNGLKNNLYSAVDKGSGLLIRTAAQDISRLLPAEQVLLKDDSSRVLITTGLYGSGKIAHSALSTSYRWMLAGDSVKYAEFWSGLVADLARKGQASDRWRLASNYPILRSGEVLVHESADQDSSSRLSVNGAAINMFRNPLLPFSWSGLVWPEHAGWNEVANGNSGSNYFYIYEPGDWTSIRARERIDMNSAFAEKSTHSDGKDPVLTEFVEKELSSWWWFLLFLLSMAFIWFETKLL